MHRTPHPAGVSVNGLFAIFCLVLFVAGVPVVVKRARDAEQVLTRALGDHLSARAPIGG